MSQRTPARLLVTAVLFVAAVIIYRVHWDPYATLRDLRYETASIAVSLAEHGTFANPFLTPTGPTAFLAPAYPAYLALLMKLFGTGPAAAFAIQFSVTLFIAIQMAFLPWLSDRIGMGFWAGAVASVVMLLADFPRDDLWEAWVTALVFMLAVDAMTRAGSPEASRKRIILTGVGFGALLLLAPVALTVLPFWIGWLLVRRTWDIKRAALFCVCVLAAFAPWTIRNYAVFHRVMYVRNNFGMEMKADYNDCATYSFLIDQASGCFARNHPNESPELAAQVRDVGEVEYNRRALAEAKAWMQQHPQRVRKLIRQKFEVFWFPSIAHARSHSPRRFLMVTIATILGFFGLVLLWWKNRTSAAVLTSWLLGFPPAYYLVHYVERYRTPMLWMSFLLAAYLIIEVVGRVSRMVKTTAV